MSQATNLPDCKKCNNKRKIQAGFMDRPCICTRTTPIHRVKSPPHNEVTHKPLPFETPAVPQSIPEVKQDALRQQAESQTTTQGTVTEVTATANTIVSEPEPVQVATASTTEQPVKSKRLGKSEVAKRLGAQMGYTPEVIEAIMCERETDPQVWERKYAHIYVHPLATALPPNYDPTKFIPGDSARDSFRDMVNQNLPNKKRKVNFEDMIDPGLANGENG